MFNEVKLETAPDYGAKRATSDDEVIRQALEILAERLRKPGQALSTPDDTRRFLSLKLRARLDEVFVVLYLDNRHRVVECIEQFFGTIDGTSVHPRVIVRTALELNASAIICAHNHPSGASEPSQADRSLTRRLQDALGLVDVRLLDHLVIGEEVTSFAERGLL